MSSNDPSPFGDQDDYPVNPFAAPQAVEELGQMSPAQTGELTLNPWVSMWTKPRATIRQIVDTDPKRNVAALAAVSGAAGALSNSLTSGLDVGPALIGAVVGSLVFGAAFGVLFWLLFSWLAKVVSGWLGGQATLENMRAAYAWPIVVSIWGTPLAVIAFFITGPDGEPDGLQAAFGLMAVGLAQVVIGVWSLVVLCKCIGEVSLLSAWKGFGTLILIGFICAVPVMLIGFAVYAAVTA